MLEKIKGCLDGSDYKIKIKHPGKRNQWLKYSVISICEKVGNEYNVISFLETELDLKSIKRKFDEGRRGYHRATGLDRVEELLKPLYREDILNNILNEV